jgi:hypothetical protein
MNESPISLERFRNFAIPLGSFAVLVAMITVLNFHVAGSIESAVRLPASALGLAAIPILLVLAFRDWRRNQRARLSTRRSTRARFDTRLFCKLAALLGNVPSVSDLAPLSSIFGRPRMARACYLFQPTRFHLGAFPKRCRPPTGRLSSPSDVGLHPTRHILLRLFLLDAQLV